jgi:hypothetical protein
MSVMFVSFHIYIYNIGDNIGLSMKILLTLVICSQTAGTCMPPFEWPDRFRTQYDCLMFGYKESIKKMEEIGRTDVNQYNMFIKFYCTPEKTI